MIEANAPATCRHPVQKRDVLFLRGEMSFQGVFAEVSRFDGRPAPRMSTKSMSVVEALTDRRGSDPGYVDRRVIETLLLPGSIASVLLGLLSWDSIGSCRGLPSSRLSFRNAIDRLCEVKFEWHFLEKRKILFSIYNLVVHEDGVLAYDDASTLEKYNMHQGSALRLGWSWLWSEVSSLTESRLYLGKPWWGEWRPGGLAARYVALFAGDRNLLVLSATLDICLTWLQHGSRFFHEHSSRLKNNMRCILEHQLHEASRRSVCLVSSALTMEVGGLLAITPWWKSIRRLYFPTLKVVRAARFFSNSSEA